MSTKVWTSQADWRGWSSHSKAPTMDTETVANSLTLMIYLYATGFEEFTTGAMPPDYSEVGTGEVLVATDQAQSGSKSLKCTDSDGANHIGYIDNLGLNTNLTYQAYMRAHGSGGGNATFTISVDNQGAALFVQSLSMYKGDGHWKYYNGTGSVNLPTDTQFVLDQWYKVKMTINLTTKKARFYIDDSYKGEVSVSYTTATDCGSAIVYDSTTGSSGWIDNIKIWNLYDSDPTLYQSPATVNYQFDSGVTTGTTETKWNSFTFTATKPANTNVRFRFKTASTQAALASALWSAYYTTAGNLTDVTDGRWIEVQIELSTTDGVSTPQLDDLTLTYTTVSGLRFI